MFDDITPVLLTYNEAPNLQRTLAHLTWARDIVIVDSGSSDETLRIIAEFPRIRIFHRPFDTHCEQWRFAVLETDIKTPWILRLDADYVLSREFVAELMGLDLSAANAYQISFDYSVFSQPLRTSLYPSNTILLRCGCFKVWDNGHTEAWSVEGPIKSMHAKVIHDDWKSLDKWLASQARYMRRELDKISVQPRGLRDWLRLHPPLMPIAALFYCLIGKGLILDGWPGLYYTLQRTVAETILTLLLIEKILLTPQSNAKSPACDSRDGAPHGTPSTSEEKKAT